MSGWLYVATTTETQAHHVFLLVKWVEIIPKMLARFFGIDYQHDS